MGNNVNMTHVYLSQVEDDVTPSAGMDLRVSSTSASPKKRKFPLAEDSTHKLLSPVVSSPVLY